MSRDKWIDLQYLKAFMHADTLFIIICIMKKKAEGL